MATESATKRREAKRRQLKTLFETFSLEPTLQFDTARTLTVRPSADLESLDLVGLLEELPWLTQHHAEAKYAEICQWLGMRISTTLLLFNSLLILATALVPTLLARRVLMRNLLNRNIIYVMFLSLVYAAFARGLGWVLDLPVHAVLTLEMLIYSAFSLLVGLFADRFVYWMSAALAGGALVAAIFPDHAIESLGISQFIGFLAVAAAWRRVDRRA